MSNKKEPVEPDDILPPLPPAPHIDQALAEYATSEQERNVWQRLAADGEPMLYGVPVSLCERMVACSTGFVSSADVRPALTMTVDDSVASVLENASDVATMVVAAVDKTHRCERCGAPATCVHTSTAARLAYFCERCALAIFGIRKPKEPRDTLAGERIE